LDSIYAVHLEKEHMKCDIMVTYLQFILKILRRQKVYFLN